MVGWLSVLNLISLFLPKLFHVVSLPGLPRPINKHVGMQVHAESYGMRMRNLTISRMVAGKVTSDDPSDLKRWQGYIILPILLKKSGGCINLSTTKKFAPMNIDILSTSIYEIIGPSRPPDVKGMCSSPLICMMTRPRKCETSLAFI